MKKILEELRLSGEWKKDLFVTEPWSFELGAMMTPHPHCGIGMSDMKMITRPPAMQQPPPSLIGWDIETLKSYELTRWLEKHPNAFVSRQRVVRNRCFRGDVAFMGMRTKNVIVYGNVFLGTLKNHNLRCKEAVTSSGYI